MLSLRAPTNGCWAQSTCPSAYRTFCPALEWFGLFASCICLLLAVSPAGAVTLYPDELPGFQSAARAKSADLFSFQLNPALTAVVLGYMFAKLYDRLVVSQKFDRSCWVFVPPPYVSFSSLD